MCVVSGAILLLSACATKAAPDFGGRWKPVNRFAKTTMEIPLYKSYVYQATPMDGTLKAMLERWAKDSSMDLDYKILSDYTLFGAVAEISSTNVNEAAASLSAVYAGQGVSVVVVGNKIVVQPASSSAAKPGANQ
ncbi:hypothetical protein [Xanthomonas cannabis]|uniref:hypothetical protein n=1 Tax=Xanthomonas TaxID=338 RepID=UPI000573DE03|nr:hypothetical protein [Xanthomonas cannabis]MCC4607149.1 hypothetical protein [Xanthomonas campestris pv. zinniae]MCC4611910.1 hypothetical protein [Xanthomonas campestris pv. esculenti]KHL57323.1 hypothetical protein OZ13_07230 [Xanthomonas cannabis pv. cannabis]KHL60297.1 hypothetical protein OZ10_00055 [Xanthomonas cannabis pv. cannabis]MCC8444148.1 hypothetical protein [Xanthomonas cannabis]